METTAVTIIPKHFESAENTQGYPGHVVGQRLVDGCYAVWRVTKLLRRWCGHGEKRRHETLWQSDLEQAKALRKEKCSELQRGGHVNESVWPRETAVKPVRNPLNNR